MTRTRAAARRAALQLVLAAAAVVDVDRWAQDPSPLRGLGR